MKAVQLDRNMLVLYEGCTIRQEHARCMKAVQLDKNMLVV